MTHNPIKKFELQNCIINEPNCNGRIYTEECFEEMQEKVKNSKVFLTMGIVTSISVPLDKVIGIVKKIELKNNKINATIQMIDTPVNRIFQELNLNKAEMCVVPCGIGIVKEDGRVEDYNLISMNYVANGVLQ